MTVSRQTERNRESDLKRLRQLVPADCPLLVTRRDGDYCVEQLDTDHVVGARGRYQIVYCWIDGFVTAWNFSKTP